MNKSGSYRHILKYTGIFGSIQAVNVLASIVRNKVAAVLIDRYGQGVSELFNNTINLISSATTLIIPASIIRRVSVLYEKHGEDSVELSEEIKIVRSWSVLTGLIATILVLISSPILSKITFGDYNFTNSYIYLSPMLILLSINGTEVAILKGTHRLKQLATSSILASIATMVICVVSYYFWRLRGIVISLDACLFITTLLNLKYTLKAHPYKASPFNWSLLSKGGEIIRLSIAFLVATVFASLAEMLIRTYISNSGSIENVGLYGAGFALTVTYTRFIFTAMDADFYPRLSGACDDATQMNVAINRQIVVCVLLIVPCLIVFNLFLPQIIRILYTSKYNEVIGMVMCASIYMFLKAVVSPPAYTSLAKGDSKMYLTMETMFAISLAACVIGGYSTFGLTGCGIGLSASNLVELILILSLYKKAYGIKLNQNTVAIVIIQFFILVGGLLSIALIPSLVVRFVIVFILFAISAAFSFFTFLKSKD